MPRPLAVLLTVAAAAAILLGPAPDASAVPAPIVSPSTVPPGSSFTVSGTGCWDPDFDPSRHRPGEWNVFIMTGIPPASVDMTAATGGAWSITLRVPPGWAPGSFSVEPFCRLSNGSAIPYPKMWVTVPPPGPAPTAVGPRVPAAPFTPGAAPRIPSSTAPRTEAPAASAAAPTSAAATTTTAAPTTAAPTTAAVPVAPSATAGCSDCAKLTGGAPVTAGQALTLTYSGFQPGETVTLVMRSTPVELGTFTADASGVVTATVTLPASAEVGSHTLTFSGPVTGDHVLRFRLASAQQRETAAASASTDPTLPLTLGGSVLVLLLAAGVFLVRRRRTAAAEPPAQPAATPIAAPIA